MQDNTAGHNQALDLEARSPRLVEAATSENLPKNVSIKLFELMTKVVESDVNPKTVQAACACATEIHRMLKLNMELRKGK